MNSLFQSNSAYLTVRILLGLLLLPNAIAPFFIQPEVLGMPDQALTTFKFFWNTGYLMYAVKFIEFITALSLLSNLYIKLTTVLFAPVAVNIILFHLFLAPQGLGVGIFTLLLLLFILIRNSDAYQSMLQIS